jgi:hypothetical protein
MGLYAGQSPLEPVKPATSGFLPADKFMQLLHSTHAESVLVNSDRLAYLFIQRQPETVAKHENESFMFVKFSTGTPPPSRRELNMISSSKSTPPPSSSRTGQLR